MSKSENLKTFSTFSMATSFNSPPTIIGKGDNVSYQIDITTSDSIGNFSVQGSNTYNPQAPSNLSPTSGTWVTLALSGVPFANAANDNIVIDLNQPTFNAIRLVYTSSTPGTGNCVVSVLAKGLGA